MAGYFYMARVFVCIYTHLYVFLCQWRCGYFHVLAIINSATMNIGVDMSFSVMVFSGYMPSSGVAESYGRFIPSF